MSRASALYGSLGVMFAIHAWLLFFGRLVVYAAVVNVVAREEGHGCQGTATRPAQPALAR